MGRPDFDAPTWGHMDRTLHRGQRPRTTFLDMEDAKRVTVLDYPGQSPRKANAAVSFAKTCHAPEPMDIAPHETLDQVMAAASSGSLLWQVAETLHYSLRLEGLTRVCSHQLVRARVGWTFSETCTGDHDWRHGDFLIPRGWMKRNDHGSKEGWLEMAIQHMLGSKHYYAAMIDGVSIYPDATNEDTPSIDYLNEHVLGTPNDARYMLHPSLKVFVHAETNLAALKEWYAKRCCTMTQSYEMVVLAEKVKAAVLAVTPWAAKAFVSPCEQGKCWYLGAYKQPLAMANYFKPDATHASFMDDWNPKSFLFADRTHYQMSSGDVPFATRRYAGYTLLED